MEAGGSKKLIARSEILAVATDLGLAPEIVEKDYVLGWLLNGIYTRSTGVGLDVQGRNMS